MLIINLSNIDLVLFEVCLHFLGIVNFQSDSIKE